MLYFIKSQEYLKIEYVKNAVDYNKKIKNYLTYNPKIEVIDVTIEGTLEDEETLHKLLSEYIYNNSWFYNNSKIYSAWKQYTKNMQRISEYYSDYFIKDSTEISLVPEYESENSENKLSDIAKDVHNEFKDECTLTGEQIKEKLTEIYSKHGAYFYPDIKTLSKFGYSMIRKCIDGTMTYFIKREK